MTIVDLDTGQILGVVDGRDHKGVGDSPSARPLSGGWPCRSLRTTLRGIP
ncbi:hypothetical protein [Arthrobacter sp. SLBN-112]|nr:hypothetical protein [Arthrobacter sp. SLBN-112]